MDYVNVYRPDWTSTVIGHIKLQDLTAEIILQLAKLGYSLELPKQAG